MNHYSNNTSKLKSAIHKKKLHRTHTKLTHRQKPVMKQRKEIQATRTTTEPQTQAKDNKFRKEGETTRRLERKEHKQQKNRTEGST